MQPSQWTALDYLFVIIVLISIAFAVLKGLAREIVSLVALVGGFILAVHYYPVVGSALAGYCRTGSVADFLGFSIIFLGCVIAGAVVAYVMNRFIKAAALKWVDRALGGVFGLIRGWAIASILVFALIAFPIRENFVAHSALAPYFLAGARTAIFLVPQDLKDAFNVQYKKVLEAWNKNRGAL